MSVRALTECRAQQLVKREAAIAAREERVGGMDSDLLADSLQAVPNGHGQAGRREVWSKFRACCSQDMYIVFLQYRKCVCLVTLLRKCYCGDGA